MTSSSRLVSESFVFGNLGVVQFGKYAYDLDTNGFKDIVETFAGSKWERELHEYWNIINNLNIFNSGRVTQVTINHLRFTKRIFNILESKFKENFDTIGDNFNFTIMKCFVVSNIKKVAVMDKNFAEIFEKGFKRELDYMKKFNLKLTYNNTADRNILYTYSYSYISDNSQVTISSTLPELYSDEMIVFPKVTLPEVCPPILSKVTTRLENLKIHAPEYFKALEPYLKEYSIFALDNYPLRDLYNNYRNLMYISDAVLKPFGISADEFEGSNALLSIVHEYLRSYLLGFPYMSDNYITEKAQTDAMKLFYNDRDAYYKSLQERNRNYIKSKMFLDSCSNGVDDNGDYVNLVYTPVVNYNIDDICVLMSNNTYFVFNYPEFKDILETEKNPYNREKLRSMNQMHSTIFVKDFICGLSKERGIDIELNGDLKENYEEVLEQVMETHKSYTNSKTIPVSFSSYGTDVESILSILNRALTRGTINVNTINSE